MFGFGNENKEKLKENMDEIKDMIEKGESLQEGGQKNQQGPEQNQLQTHQQHSQTPADQQTQSQNPSPEMQSEQTEKPVTDSTSENQLEDFEDEFEQQEKNRELEQEIMEKESAAAEKHERVERTGKDNWQEGPTERKSPAPNRTDHSMNQSREDNFTSSRVSSGESGSTTQGRSAVDAKIPEPAKTRELNVPEIEKGPLFIRRQKFEYASRLIQEMRYLSQQVENTVNDIEADIQKDRETESQVREILQEFEEDRTEVERIVSPDKE